MATTAAGWPYIEDTDFPLEYPVTSQALANKLQTFDVPVSTLLTPVNGFANVGTFPLTVTYNGAAAHLLGDVRRASGAMQTILEAGGLPVGARPSSPASNTVISVNGAAIGPVFYVNIRVDGSVYLTFPTQTPAWTTSTTIGIAASWAV